MIDPAFYPITLIVLSSVSHIVAFTCGMVCGGKFKKQEETEHEEVEEDISSDGEGCECKDCSCATRTY